MGAGSHERVESPRLARTLGLASWSKLWPMDEAAIGQHIETLRAKLVGGASASYTCPNSTGSMRTEFLGGTTSRIIGVDGPGRLLAIHYLRPVPVFVIDSVCNPRHKPCH